MGWPWCTVLHVHWLMGSSQQSFEVNITFGPILNTKKLRIEGLSNLPKAILLIKLRLEIKVRLSPQFNFSIITNDIPERSLLADQGVRGMGEDLNVWADLNSRNHGADSPIRADLPSYNQCPFSEVRLRGAQKTRADSHLPNEGWSIMLVLFCFFFFFSYFDPYTVLLQTPQIQVTKLHLKLAYTNRMFQFISLET